MYYQFKNGICVSTSTFEPAFEVGIISVWCDEVYTDIGNLRLINGQVVHVVEGENEND